MTILELTKKLIAIPSVSTDQHQCKTVFDCIVDLFVKTKGIFIDREEINGVHSLIIKNFDGQYADICFNGHIDVVPPQAEDQRTPIEREWMLFGRGAGDMKDGIAIISLLMVELCKPGMTNKKIMLMLTADEEVWWSNGVGYLVEQWYGADIVLIPDGGNRHEMVIAEKWIINLTLNSTGQAWHSSKPWLYENAIEKLILAYNAIKARIETAELYEEPDHRGCSVQLTTITWWQATNMIPAHASWTINIRYTQSTSYERIIQRIEEILKTFWEMSYTVQIHGWLLFTDPSHRIVKKYQSIAHDHVGRIELIKEHGSSDWRFFAEQGAVVILHRPTNFDIHWPEERTTIADFETIYKIYKDFALNV